MDCQHHRMPKFTRSFGERPSTIDRRPLEIDAAEFALLDSSIQATCSDFLACPPEIVHGKDPKCAVQQDVNLNKTSSPPPPRRRIPGLSTTAPSSFMAPLPLPQLCSSSLAGGSISSSRMMPLVWPS